MFSPQLLFNTGFAGIAFAAVVALPFAMAEPTPVETITFVEPMVITPSKPVTTVHASPHTTHTTACDVTVEAIHALELDRRNTAARATLKQLQDALEQARRKEDGTPAALSAARDAIHRSAGDAEVRADRP